MPLPANILRALGRLSPSVRTEISRAVKGGSSARQIHRVLTGQGIAISRGRTLNPIVNALKAERAFSSRVKYVNRKYVPDVFNLPVALTKLAGNVSWNVRVITRNSAGKTGIRWIQVVTDSTDRSIGDILAQAAEVYSEGQYGDDQPVSFTIEGGTRSADDDWF